MRIQNLGFTLRLNQQAREPGTPPLKVRPALTRRVTKTPYSRLDLFLGEAVKNLAWLARAWFSWWKTNAFHRLATVATEITCSSERKATIGRGRFRSRRPQSAVATNDASTFRVPLNVRRPCMATMLSTSATSPACH